MVDKKIQLQSTIPGMTFEVIDDTKDQDVQVQEKADSDNSETEKA